MEAKQKQYMDWLVLGDLYVSAIGGRNSLMGKYLGEGSSIQ
jgi:glycerol-3-phosphate dehydrogenase